MQHRVPPQVHTLLNRFVHSFTLICASPGVSSSVTQLLPQLHYILFVTFSSNATLTPLLSVPSSVASDPPLNEPFCTNL